MSNTSLANTPHPGFFAALELQNNLGLEMGYKPLLPQRDLQQRLLQQLQEQLRLKLRAQTGLDTPASSFDDLVDGPQADEPHKEPAPLMQPHPFLNPGMPTPTQPKPQAGAQDKDAANHDPRKALTFRPQQKPKQRPVKRLQNTPKPRNGLWPPRPY